MSKPYERLRVDLLENGVAEVVLNRPEQLNMMDGDFFDEIGRVFADLDKNPKVNVIFLWAEGKLFTAGLDLKAAAGFMGGGEGSATDQTVELFHTIQRWQKSFNAPRSIKKPVIAAIHNKCLGGGIDLITSCDIRLATKDAVFFCQRNSSWNRC